MPNSQEKIIPGMLPGHQYSLSLPSNSEARRVINVAPPDENLTFEMMQARPEATKIAEVQQLLESSRGSIKAKSLSARTGLDEQMCEELRDAYLDLHPEFRKKTGFKPTKTRA